MIFHSQSHIKSILEILLIKCFQPPIVKILKAIPLKEWKQFNGNIKGRLRFIPWKGAFVFWRYMAIVLWSCQNLCLQPNTTLLTLEKTLMHFKGLIKGTTAPNPDYSDLNDYHLPHIQWGGVIIMGCDDLYGKMPARAIDIKIHLRTRKKS